MPQTTTSSILRLNIAQNEVLDYQYMRALAYGTYGAASIGELLKIVQDINRRGMTRDAWINTWAGHGRRVREQAEAAARQGQRATARGRFLRAYNYLRAAEFFFYRSEPAAHRALYDESVACFDQGMALLDTPVTKIAIPYAQGISLPGYFYQVDGTPTPRATVIICGGGDSFGEESYLFAGVPEALARGLNVILFHGPGQRGLLHYHPQEVFRPDYEAPIRAVVDYALSRPEVNPQKLAIYGYSLGGYFAPRAAAYDPRIKALVANGPMLDFHDWILGGVLTVLPGYFRPFAQRIAGHIPAGLWNSISRRTLNKDWVYQATFELYMGWTNGVETFAEYLQKVRQYTLVGLVEQIKCPTLCLSGEGEGPEPIAQAQRFFKMLQAPKTLYNLSVADGADNHCGVNNIAYTSSIAYDWVNEVFEHGAGDG